jgi:hypothetical protein
VNFCLIQQHTSVACASLRCLVRRRAALRAEVSIYVREFPELTAAEVRDSIKADGEHPWPYSVRYISELMNEVYDERAAS